MDGKVLGIMLWICVYKLICVIVVVKFVVLDSGDILLLNQVFDIMVLVYSVNEIFSILVMFISVRLSVFIVFYDVLVKIEISVYSKQVVGKNQLGEMSFIF